jgi:hypothetical protein
LTFNRKMPLTKIQFGPNQESYTIIEEDEDASVSRSRDNSNYLNHVMWSSGLEQKLRDGFVTKILVFFPKDEPHFWCLSDDLSSLLLTREEKKAGNFKILSTSKDQIIIMTSNEQNIVFADRKGVRVKRRTSDISIDSLFGIETQYGEDLAVISFQNDMSIISDDNTKSLGIGRLPLTKESILPGTYERSLKHMMFFHPGEEDQIFYLSLNRIVNSMRYKDSKDKILDWDETFNNILEKGKKENHQIDDILTASYSFYLLVTKLFLVREKIPENLDALIRGENLEKIENNLILFRQHLHNNPGQSLIPLKTWNFYIKEMLRELEEETDQILLSSFKVKEFLQLVVKISLFNIALGKPWNSYFIELEKEAEQLSSKNETNNVRERIIQVQLKIKFFYSALEKNQEIDTTSVQFSKLTKNWSENRKDFEAFLFETLSFNSHSGRSVLLTRDGNCQSMVLVRATGTAAANRMKSTWCLARKISEDFTVEFVQDFGDGGTSLDKHLDEYLDLKKLKSDLATKKPISEKEPTCRLLMRIQTERCNNKGELGTNDCNCSKYRRKEGSCSLVCTSCLHIHKMLHSYEDLEGLPCFLILVDNGRMGDTFPRSLHCMDLRLHLYKSNPKTYLSTFVQEIGRLCRYTTLSSPFPKALLGKGIYKFLEKSLRDDATYSKSFYDKKLFDAYVVYNENKTILEASKESADFKNTKRDNRRNDILLQAEPQIGKTGTFLAVIGLLREKICNDLEIEDESESETEELKPEHENFPISALHWKFPYWKALKDLPNLPTESSKGKYDRFDGGPFVYPSEAPTQIKRTPRVSKARLKNDTSIVEFYQELEKMKFVAHRSFHSCAICPADAPFEVIELKNLSDEMLKLSLPSFKKPYHALKALIQSKCPPQSSDIITEQELIDEIFWIMTPSSGRHDSAKLNLQHTMVKTENGEETPVAYVHIIFVRQDEFELYCSKWQHSHAILTLPSQLEDCDETVDSGGIGYARRFIQNFCQKLGIKNYLQNDDNIRGYWSYKMDENNVLIRNGDNGLLVPIETTLYEILNIFTEQSKCESKSFEFGCDYEQHVEHPKPLLGSYTGPWTNFGVLGMRKFRHTSYKVCQNPFLKTHVTSSVFFNGEQLEKKGVKFQAWPYREDLQFNCDAAAEDLEVLKFNRFLLVKEKSLPMPYMIFWDENTKLSNADDVEAKTPLKEDKESFKLTLKHLRLLKPTSFELISVPPENLIESPWASISRLHQNITKYHQSGALLIGIGNNSLDKSVLDQTLKHLTPKVDSATTSSNFNAMIGNLNAFYILTIRITFIIVLQL